MDEIILEQIRALIEEMRTEKYQSEKNGQAKAAQELLTELYLMML